MTIINPPWVPPIEATFDEGKPIRSQQGLALAGNPIAMAEGASGAPRFARKVLYTNSIGAAVSGLSGYNGCRVDYKYSVGPPDGNTVTLQFSDDGTTWPASLTLGVSTVDGINLGGFIYVDFATGSYTNVPGVSVTAGTIASMPSAPTHVRINSSAGTGTGYIVVVPDGGVSLS